MTIRELRSKRADQIREARALFDRADREKRDFTPSEQKEWDGHMAQAESLAVTIRNRERQEELEADLEKRQREIVRSPSPGDGDPHYDASLYGSRARVTDGEERRWLDYAHDAGLTPEQRKYRTFLGDRAAVKWFRALAQGDHEACRSAIREDPLFDPRQYEQEVRALELEGTAGGYGMVPAGFLRNLQEHKERASKLRGLVQKYPVETYDTKVPIEATHLSAGVIAEGVAITSSTDAGFTSADLKLKKIAAYTSATNELVRFGAFSLLDTLARQVGESTGLRLDIEIARGTNFTGGLVDLTPDASIDQADTTGDLDSVVDKFYALPEQFRANASWLIGDAWAKTLAKAIDLSGRPIWGPQGTEAPRAIGSAAQGSGITMLYGRPVYVFSQGLAAGNPLAADMVFFGDLSGYTLIEYGQMFAEVSKDEKFQEDKTTFRFLTFADGVVSQAERMAFFDAA